MLLAMSILKAFKKNFHSIKPCNKNGCQVK
jgi:hypothetical protein